MSPLLVYRVSGVMVSVARCDELPLAHYWITPSAPAATPAACTSGFAFAACCSLDYSVRAHQQLLRDAHTELSRGRDIDDQFDAGGLLDRQIRGLGALQYRIEIACN